MHRSLTAACAIGAAGLVVAGFATGASSQPLTSRAPHSTQQTKLLRVTTVAAVTPFTKSGALKTGWRIRNNGTGDTLDCLSVDRPIASPTSVSRDVYSCGATAQSADVCWIRSAQATHALCGTDSWRHVLIRWKLTSSPVPSVHAPKNANPWGLVLRDGTKCRIRNGSTWGTRSDNWTGAYSCDKPHVYVLASPKNPRRYVDASHRVWTVKVGDLGRPHQHFPPPRLVKVRSVAFSTSQR